jgi:hypothetical protein
MASAMIASALVIDQRRTTQLPIAYYQNKYKMGQCVIALNEYLVNNCHNSYTNFVYRMCATTQTGNYNHGIKIVNFKELFEQTPINSHVIIADNNRLVIDPLFGLEKMKMDDYVRYIVSNDLLDIKPEYKEIVFDIQPLLEKHRKNCRSQFVAMDPILCTFSVNLETKVVSM